METVRKGLVLAQQAEQQVLGLDVRAAVLARLITREENYAPCLLRIAFKHFSLPRFSSGRGQLPSVPHERTRSARRANDKLCVATIEVSVGETDEGAA